jgi:hypothetical protein
MLIPIISKAVQKNVFVYLPSSAAEKNLTG